MSTNGGSTDVGADETSVGDFSIVLAEVNPSLASGGYPEAWTEVVATVTGADTPTMGRIGFRYHVTDAGPVGTNSNYIGIDSYTVIDFVPTDVSLTSFGADASVNYWVPAAFALLVILAGAAFVVRRNQVA